MFFGIPTYIQQSAKVQMYNVCYYKVPHSTEEALKIASENAKWIFGDATVNKYPLRKVMLHNGRWKIYFMPQYDFEQSEIEPTKGIEIQLGVNTGKIRYYNLKE